MKKKSRSDVGLDSQAALPTYDVALYTDARALSDTIPPVTSPPTLADAETLTRYTLHARRLGVGGGLIAATMFLLVYVTVAHYVVNRQPQWAMPVAVAAVLAALLVFALAGSYAKKSSGSLRVERDAAVLSIARALRFDRDKGVDWNDLTSFQRIQNHIEPLFRRRGYETQIGADRVQGDFNVVASRADERIVIHCRQAPVQHAQIDELCNAVATNAASRGILVSPLGFTTAAKAYAGDRAVDLWDPAQFELEIDR